MAEPFAEMLEPCGERGLIWRWLSAITFVAHVIGHASIPATGRIAARLPPARRADHTHWVAVSQETVPADK